MPSSTEASGYSVGQVTDDPERLVAEALRAHASRTPLPATPTDSATTSSPTASATNAPTKAPTKAPAKAPAPERSEDAGPVRGGYGLLSGSGVSMPPRRPEPTVRDPTSAEETNRLEQRAGVAVGWILLLALLLGLAAGAVVGLVTLL